MQAAPAPPPSAEPAVAAAPPGAALHALLTELYPLPRSLTGEGVRQTLRLLQQRLLPGLRLHEVPSGTPVLDWTVPPEWRVREAYVATAAGERVVDWERHHLHLLGYSQPVQTWLTREELGPHLHSLPEQPELIPYRTSYYHPNWGFCLSQRQLEALEEPLYEVCVDTELDPQGSLSYGEVLLPGAVEDEVLISCHVCHPSLANDNLSGVVVAAHLAAALQQRPHRLSYRFLFIPGTIGSITWLSRQTPESLARIRHGLVATLLGGPGAFTYKRTRLGGADIDRVVAHVLRSGGYAHELRDFVPYGYDERQFCSPGFDLPVGCLSRTPHGEFPEYHTSADNCAFVRPEQLAEALQLYEQVVQVLDGNARYQNRQPYGEPQLGRRGLYGALKGQGNPREAEMALLWLLSYSDGRHDLLAIAERSGLPFAVLRRAADQLLAAELLAPLPAA
jgi:aminopeptidase-like protein